MIAVFIVGVLLLLSSELAKGAVDSTFPFFKLLIGYFVTIISSVRAYSLTLTMSFF